MISLRLKNYAWSDWQRLYSRAELYKENHQLDVTLASLSLRFPNDDGIVELSKLVLHCMVRENCVSISCPITLTNRTGLNLDIREPGNSKAVTPLPTQESVSISIRRNMKAKGLLDGGSRWSSSSVSPLWRIAASSPDPSHQDSMVASEGTKGLKYTRWHSLEGLERARVCESEMNDTRPILCSASVLVGDGGDEDDKGHPNLYSKLYPNPNLYRNHNPNLYPDLNPNLKARCQRDCE